MPAFHYVVKAKLIRHKKKDGELEFLQFEEKFEDDNPIKARNLAFKRFQSYIDVLLEGKNKKYVSDKQARVDLVSFIDPGTKSKINIENKQVEFSDAFGNGIGVFLVLNAPDQGTLFSESVSEELFIHGIGNIAYFPFDSDDLILHLEEEYNYYQSYHCDTNNQDIEVVYCSRDEWEAGHWEEEPAKYHIIETPFDWSGLDKPFWWGEPRVEKVSELQPPPKSIEQILREGESNTVEFKPALVYNFKTGKAGIGIKNIIAKTICAFLNSNGGLLFIGVTDEGVPQGLSFDYSLSDSKNKRDFIHLEFDQMIDYFMSPVVRNYVSTQFYEINGSEIFMVSVMPSKRRPIFLKNGDQKEFYVRGEASSRRIIEIEEIVNYCIDKWGANG